jgi:Big-like domain-containing protein
MSRTARGPSAAVAFATSSLSACLLLSCAKMEPPPGGPPDPTPPRLVETLPESLARLPEFRGHVEFRFDEVISEGGSPNQGTGSGDLEKLIILSPSTRVPEVRWRRDRITVRPAEGWRPDRVYRVELLPGVADLRRNRTTEGKVLTFTTGAPLPATTLQGVVVDWGTARPAPAALVEALLEPDSLPYRGVADSSGHFSLGPLPAGQYLVRGVIDENRNLRADGREAFDSVRLAKGKTDAGELWAFAHDTTPVRIRTITAADSLSAAVEFTQQLDPRQRLALKDVTVRVLPDSTPVTVVSLLPTSVDDSLHRPAGRDTTAKDSTRRDTTARARPGIAPVEEPAPRGARGARARPRRELQPLTSRPPLFDRLVLRVARPWTAGGKYEVEIRGIRNVSGVRGDTRAAFQAPKAAAPDTTKRTAKPAKPGTADTLPPKPRKKPS